MAMSIGGALPRGVKAAVACGVALAVSACGSGSMLPGTGALSNFIEMNSPVGAPSSSNTTCPPM